MAREADWKAAPELALGGALCGVIALFAWHSLYKTGPIDDAYITLRTARNWAAGLGPFFNPGEAVEATTSPLWTALLALGARLGAEPLALLFPFEVLWVAGAGAATALLTRALAGPSAALAAMAILALLPSWNLWASTGMELPLAAALLALAGWLSVQASSLRTAIATALCAAAAVLARPELALSAGVLSVAAALSVERAARPRALILTGLACAAPLIAFALWRHQTYGAWVPNTYVAKVEGGGWSLRWRGLIYTGQFLLFHLALLTAALFALRSRAAKIIALAVAAQLVAVVYSGGDHFAFGRLALPCLPLLVALAAAAVARLPKPALQAALTAVLAASGILLARPTHEREKMVAEAHFASSCERIGRALAPLPPGMVATETIGAIGYFSDRPVLDLVGLADAHIARSPRLAGAASGHDHADNDYVLQRAPFIVLPIPELVPWVWDDEKERRRLHALRRFFAAGELLVNDPRFRARYEQHDLPIGDLNLRVWLRRE